MNVTDQTLQAFRAIKQEASKLLRRNRAARDDEHFRDIARTFHRLRGDHTLFDIRMPCDDPFQQRRRNLRREFIFLVISDSWEFSSSAALHAQDLEHKVLRSNSNLQGAHLNIRRIDANGGRIIVESLSLGFKNFVQKFTAHPIHVTSDQLND